MLTFIYGGRRGTCFEVFSGSLFYSVCRSRWTRWPDSHGSINSSNGGGSTRSFGAFPIRSTGMFERVPFADLLLETTPTIFFACGHVDGQSSRIALTLNCPRPTWCKTYGSWRFSSAFFIQVAVTENNGGDVLPRVCR